MKYEGQFCSGCGKLLGENEDIVVCPVCGTPQHRECWEENGECVNVARHAEKFVWQPEAPQSEPKKESADSGNASSATGTQHCINCGGENSKEALTCIHCGAPLLGEQAQNPFQSFFNGATGNPFLYGVTLDPESEIEGAKVKDIACYVQSAASRYIQKFKDLAEKRKKLSFNWAAFFLSPYWFFFRKMWKPGLIFLGIMLAIALAFTGVSNDFQELYYSWVALDMNAVTDAELNTMTNELVGAMLKVLPMFALQGIVGITAGFLADSLYKKEVIKGVKKLRGQFPENRAYEAASLRVGGSSIFIAFAAYFGYNIVYSLLLNLAELLIN